LIDCARAIERDRTRTRDVPRATRGKSARALIRAIVVVDAILAVVRACADGAGTNGRETDEDG
jgi:hypothetical protein